MLGWPSGWKGTIFSHDDQGEEGREVTAELSSESEEQTKTYFAPIFNIKTNPIKYEDSDKRISF